MASRIPRKPTATRAPARVRANRGNRIVAAAVPDLSTKLWPTIWEADDPRFWEVVHAHIAEAAVILRLGARSDRSSAAASQILSGVDQLLREARGAQASSKKKLKHLARQFPPLNCSQWDARLSDRHEVLERLRSLCDQRIKDAPNKNDGRVDAAELALTALPTWLPSEVKPITEAEMHEAWVRLQRVVGQRDDGEELIRKAGVSLGVASKRIRNWFDYLKKSVERKQRKPLEKSESAD